MEDDRIIPDKGKKSGGLKYIVCSIVFADLLILAIIADLYFMITDIRNLVPVIILSVVCVVLTSLLVLCVIGMSGENKKAQTQNYNNQMKAQRAVYLMMKKNNGIVTDGQNQTLQAIDDLSKETVLNQKAASKVVVSRNKENTDALMNSNDIILEKLFALLAEIKESKTETKTDNNATEFDEIKLKLDQLSQTLQDGITLAAAPSVEMPETIDLGIDLPEVADIPETMDLGIDLSEVPDIPETMDLGMDLSEVPDIPEAMDLEIDLPEIPDIADLAIDIPESTEDDQEVVLKGLEELLTEEGLKEPEQALEEDEEMPDLDALLAMTEMLPEEDEISEDIQDIPLFIPEAEVTPEPEIIPELEPVVAPEPVMESKPVSIGDMDSNEKMTPEQIAELIASMTG